MFGAEVNDPRTAVCNRRGVGVSNLPTVNDSEKHIRIGIVGIGFGQHVLVPAFRRDRRCKVVAIAATSQDRADRVAARLGIDNGFAGWRALIDNANLDALAIATPPGAQPEIALAALSRGLAVFCEKPLALSLAAARDMADAAQRAGVANMVDFIFPEIGAWRKAKTIIEQGGLGRLRHVTVDWHVETATNRTGVDSWKTRSADGGGALGGFMPHSLYALEWFLGPIARIGTGLFQAPDDRRSGDTFAHSSVIFASGLGASLSVGVAAFLGPGHRLAFYGNEGTLSLENGSADYVKGFRLSRGTRQSGRLEPVSVDEEADGWEGDGRIVAASRIVRRFLDWMETGQEAAPCFKDGLRVQSLTEAARRSHETGRWEEVSTDV